jgi:hypothetical protein
MEKSVTLTGKKTMQSSLQHHDTELKPGAKQVLGLQMKGILNNKWFGTVLNTENAE